jgi:y4mF family transcriptional regulator
MAGTPAWGHRGSDFPNGNIRGRWIFLGLSVPYREYSYLTYVYCPGIFPFRNMKTIMNSAQLGAAIRAERKRLKVTQKELAMTAGVGLRYLIELERGKPTARLEGVFKVLQALGLKLSLTAPSDGEGTGTR